MGIVKSMWLQDQQQGWSDPETWVCRHCIGDDAYLRNLIRKSFTPNKTCTYCSSLRRRAAPLSAAMAAIFRGIRYNYADEASAAAPAGIDVQYHSSEYVVGDVADSQGLDWPEQLQEDIAHALTDDAWVDAAEGHWMGSHGHEVLNYSWRSFAHAVKHRSRFHFRSPPSERNYGEEVRVDEMLPFLASLVRRHRMLRKLPAESLAFRVRGGQHPHSMAELGAPPAMSARAGRMNPAGIPYFYLSMTEQTALAGGRIAVGQVATVSRWSLAKDLYILDLTRSMRAPSIFSGRWADHDLIQFLYDFVDEISQPVTQDGSEHIEYVPTQVICEFFAQSFTYAKGRTIEGIIFPSALVHGAQNLVLFPVWGYKEEPEWTQLVSLGESHQVTPGP